MRNDHPRTILHLTAPAAVGGLESVVFDLVCAQRARGHRVVLGVVLGLDSSSGLMPDKAEGVGVEVVRVVVPPRAYFQETKALARLIGSVRPDVVHTHGYRADLIGGWVTRRAGVPWVATAHGFTGGALKGRVYERLQVRALRRASAVVAVSRPIRTRLEHEGVPSDRITLLPNAWSPKPLLERSESRRRLGIADGSFVLGWVGRLSREKGADVLLDALARLGDRQWQAAVIGEGPERQALESQADRLGVGERVRWHGTIPEASALYAAFDGFVLSSRTEGTPVSLLEAVAAHVPVLACAVGGVPDMFGEGEVSLVPPERPDLLADGLRRLMADPSGARSRADAAFGNLARRFSPDAWLDAHLALYDRLTRRSPAGS